ncbi:MULTISPECIES: aldo/keto reductase [unclassified Neisseria]|uniref:aldo/keto reductase n=1 Tax=unclassified Neisseria TaxID=2623750 RepID=UPI001072B0EC|nr:MULTISPECIES: aldo/keto reductase [unclassified Neisseria]MBF0803955.1 aldo/keto reductase [Neisseria sp. 19428wB4_WF04]TFU43296.1 aldo/keto reductase [Neisseria sp. WF04]
MQKLPKTALGTWSWGTGFAGGDAVFGNNLTEAQIKEVFDTAMLEGLNLWDTAAVYGMGSSETELGKLVRKYPQGSVLLSTKFTPQTADESASDPVAAMLEGSLQRLGADAVDIYWIHNAHDVERWTPMLVPLLQSGKVKAVGVSNHNLAQIKRANEILGGAGFKVEAVQNHYSLLYRESEKAGILDYCKANGITFFAYMVLEQGALSGKYNPQNPLPQGSQRAETYNKMLPQLQKLTDAMAEIGAAQNAGAAQVAVAWAVAKGTLPIIGATKTRHVTDAAKAARLVLSADDIARLEKLADETGADTRGEWENPMA